MRRVTVVAVQILLAILMITVSRATESIDVAQQRLNILIERLQRSEIERVEILAIPSRIETPVAIRPADLESQPEYRLIVRDIRQTLLKTPLSRALKALSVASTASGADIRWGVIFFDTGGQLAAKLFLNGDGTVGELDSLPITANGQLVKWLRSTFSECFA